MLPTETPTRKGEAMGTDLKNTSKITPKHDGYGNETAKEAVLNEIREMIKNDRQNIDAVVNLDKFYLNVYE